MPSKVKQKWDVKFSGSVAAAFVWKAFGEDISYIDTCEGAAGDCALKP